MMIMVMMCLVVVVVRWAAVEWAMGIVRGDAVCKRPSVLQLCASEC